MRITKVVIVSMLFIAMLFSFSQAPVSANSEIADITKIGEVINGAHSESVVAFSPVDNIFASAGSDNKIRFWNSDNLSLIATIKGYEDVYELVFNADGTKLLVRGREILAVVDVATTETVYSVGNAIDATFDSTGTKVFSIVSVSYSSRKVVHWDLTTSKAVLEYQVPSNAVTIDYDAKNEQLAIGYSNSDIGIRDAKTGNHLRNIVGIDKYTDKHKLVYSESNGFLFSIINLNTNQTFDKKGILRIFDSTTFELLYTSTFDNVSISDVVVSEDGAFYIVQTQNRNNSLNMFERTIIYDAISNDVLATTTSSISVGQLAVNPTFTKLFAGGSYYDISGIKRQEIKELAIKTNAKVYAPNEIIDLKLEAHYGDGRTIIIPNEQVKWSTSNNTVARFIAGKLQANQQGIALITAEYKGFKVTIPVEVSAFIELPAEENVAQDKVWDITFSKNVNLQTIKEQNIYIVDENNTVIPLLYYVNNTVKNKVSLIPVKNYQSGKVYTIVVKDVSSENNEVLQQFKIKKFTVR